jgi:hypothetical protein
MDSSLHLSEEEKRIIEFDSLAAQEDAEKIEATFMDMLNEYLDTHYEIQNIHSLFVPADGSCLYHAILVSYQSKFEGFQLELNHYEMRKRVSTYLLQHIDDDNHLVRFQNFFPLVLPQGILESRSELRNRYINYFKQHKEDTTHWPIELCIETITKIYGFEIIVLGERYYNGKKGNQIEVIFESKTINDDYTTIVIANRWNFHYYGIGLLLLTYLIYIIGLTYLLYVILLQYRNIP